MSFTIRSPGQALWPWRRGRAGRNVVANDLSPYAALLTRAKLFPYRSLESALEDIEKLSREADR